MTDACASVLIARSEIDVKRQDKGGSLDDRWWPTPRPPVGSVSLTKSEVKRWEVPADAGASIVMDAF